MRLGIKACPSSSFKLVWCYCFLDSMKKVNLSCLEIFI